MLKEKGGRDGVTSKGFTFCQDSTLLKRINPLLAGSSWESEG
jgi:hypothetical protein